MNGASATFRGCFPVRMLLFTIIQVLFAILGLGCEQKVEAQNSNTIYVDGGIWAGRSTTYDPVSRACGHGTETAYRSLGGAADQVFPGQTVLIRAGRYQETLRPRQSGAPGRYISFQSLAGEDAVITGASLEPAIDISDRDYIRVEGITVTEVRRWLYARNTHHSIIKNCRFSAARDPGGSSKTGLFFEKATYNALVGNTIEGCSADSLSLVKSDRNRIEGNVFRKARHTLWTIKGGNFNILRNNYFHNEFQKIGEVYDCFAVGFEHDLYDWNCTKYNLIEKNRFAYTPSSGNASPYAGIQYAGQNGILRNNLFYETTGPALDLTLYPPEALHNMDNHIYHNVFYACRFAGISLSPSPQFSFRANILKNNLLVRSVFAANDTRWPWWTRELAGKPVQLLAGRLDGFSCQNNGFFAPGENVPYLITLGSRDPLVRNQPPLRQLQARYPQLFQDNLECDPLFTDASAHNFHLQAASPAIDAGAFLTQTVGAGSGVELPVEDAGYFFDGYGIPGEKGDLIRLASQDRVARILHVDYERNVLELSQSLVWEKGQGVSLYYLGNRPDLGAFEFVANDNQPPVAEFTADFPGDDPAAVNLDGSASHDAEGTVVQYHWDLGDGNDISSDQPRLHYVYARPGTYEVTLRVTDQGAPSQHGTALLAVRVGRPSLVVETERLTFGVTTERRTVTLRNTGAGTLVYQIRSSAPWLLPGRTSGRFAAERCPLVVQVDRAHLQAGRYDGTVTVDAGPAGARQVTVSLEVPRLRALPLVAVGDLWRYFRGVTAPPENWNAPDFDDVAWPTGPSGIGYSDERSYATDLKDMYGNYTAVYMRRCFALPDPNAVVRLELGMRYDDGFVAYLNGREVARSPSLGPPGFPTRFTMEPWITHHDAGPEEVHTVAMKPGLLVAGPNVLALEFHNMAARSSAACAVPRLTGWVTAGPE